MQLLPVALLLGLGYAFFRGQSQVASQVQYRITRVKVNTKSISLTGIDIVTTFEITNPSNGNTRINSIGGTINAGSQYLGQFNYLKPFDLVPRGVVKIDIVTNIDSMEAAKLLFSSITQLKIPAFTIKGNINTPLAAVPFDYTTKPTNV